MTIRENKQEECAINESNTELSKGEVLLKAVTLAFALKVGFELTLKILESSLKFSMPLIK